MVLRGEGGLDAVLLVPGPRCIDRDAVTPTRLYCIPYTARSHISTLMSQKLANVLRHNLEFLVQRVGGLSHCVALRVPTSSTKAAFRHTPGPFHIRNGKRALGGFTQFTVSDLTH